MPLIILCGYPCSGKSSVVHVLSEALRSSLTSPREVTVISEPIPDGTADDPRASIYADSLKERELRGHHKSEIERALSVCNVGAGAKGRSANEQRVVIMDAGNYIKGYRYELYCLAKSLKHAHAVLFCDTPAEVVTEWNAKISRYPADLLSDMIARFEPPQASQRWDKPLLVIHPHLWPSADQINVESLLAELHETVLHQGHTSAKPNRSTQLAQVAPTDFLQELERTTQAIVDHILQAQSMNAQYVSLPPSLTKLSAPDSTGIVKQLNLIDRPRRFTLPELARAKRLYIGLQRSKLTDATRDHKPPDAVSIASGFLQYLACSDRQGDDVQ